MRLNECLKQFRLMKNLSQTDFAKEIGVSYVTINRLENNRHYKPGYKTISKIAHYCGYSVEDIRKML